MQHPDRIPEQRRMQQVQLVVEELVLRERPSQFKMRTGRPRADSASPPRGAAAQETAQTARPSTHAAPARSTPPALAPRAPSARSSSSSSGTTIASTPPPTGLRRGPPAIRRRSSGMRCCTTFQTNSKRHRTSDPPGKVQRGGAENAEETRRNNYGFSPRFLCVLRAL